MQEMWQIRYMMALALLAVCAYTDIKERNIYILPLLVCVLGAQSVLLLSLAGEPKGEVQSVLLFEVLLPLAVGIVMIMIVKAGRAHIGMGDGYLMAALTLMTGVETGSLSILVAFLGSAVYGCLKIAAAKKRYVRSIPFAPFVLAGFITVLINEI